MEFIYKNFSSIAFSCTLISLGWLFGRSWHKNIPEQDAIRLPDWAKFIFGMPGANSQHNIRGIYFQIFIMLYALPFLLVDLDVISRQDAFRVVFLGMGIFPILEIIRWKANRH